MEEHRVKIMKVIQANTEYANRPNSVDKAGCAIHTALLWKIVEAIDSNDTNAYDLAHEELSRWVNHRRMFG